MCEVESEETNESEREENTSCQACERDSFSFPEPSAQIDTALLPVRKGREKVWRRPPTKLFVARLPASDER